MSLKFKITSKLQAGLVHILILSFSIAICSCNENSNDSSKKQISASNVSNSQPIINNYEPKSSLDIKTKNSESGYIQDPPTASRPRFPTPNPEPISPTPSQETQEGAQ